MAIDWQQRLVWLSMDGQRHETPVELKADAADGVGFIGIYGFDPRRSHFDDISLVE